MELIQALDADKLASDSLQVLVGFLLCFDPQKFFYQRRFFCR
jgi:hypothetical protein